MLSFNKKHWDVDTILACSCIVVFAVCVHTFQYRGVLGESDLYRVLNGMLDGANSGAKLGSDLHYGRDFGFGYILALYALLPNEILRDPDRLIPIINDIGFYFVIVGLFFFWLSTRLVYGARAAMVAMALFAFSPMILELATSGHQVLIAFCFLSIAATFLFWPLAGWRAALAASIGAILLICGLCMRAEIFLALPYLVLMRTKTTSWRIFIRSFIANSIAPAAALIAFFILRHYTASLPGNTAGFFGQFYHWSSIAPGLVYMALGCGIATVLVGTGVLAFLVIRSVRSPEPIDAKITVDQLIGPIALIIVPFVFWVANPQPSRHFLLVLAGFAILIGWAVNRLLAFRVVPALVTVLAIIVANQVLSEVVRPILLRTNAARSPYRSPPQFSTTFTHAPLGWSWQHHSALEDRLLRWKALGDTVATACDTNVVIFSDESDQLFSRLYAGGLKVQSSVGYVDGFLAFSGTLKSHHFVFMPKMTGWPKDAIASVLSDPRFNGYQLYADPYLPSVYDKTAIPADRIVRFGCKT
jgi:hypothetical protein